MDLFADNLEALEGRSPETARLVRAATDAGDYSLACAADGSPIVERGGRPLDSRRAPCDAARRQAGAIAGDEVVVVGLGAGYFLEAVLESHRRVGALVEGDPRALAAAMRARDLRAILHRVPVILLDALDDPVERACLKGRIPALAPHGGSVAAEPRLRAFVDAWPSVEAPTRAPRVLVVGPILGGSLETARSTASAVQALGADAVLLDFADFAGGWRAFAAMPLLPAHVEQLQAGYAAAVGEAVLAQASSFAPDLVLALAQAPLGVSQLQRLRAAGMRTAFWFVENGRVLPYWKTVAAAYDTFFAIQPGDFLDELRRAGAPRAVYLPTACDARRHVPVVLDEAERERFAADVSFAGAPYLNRRRLLFALTGFDLRLWGEGWSETELRAFSAEGGARFSLDEMIRIFAGSKVNLNVHSAAHVDGLDPVPDYVNPRTFELAACGAFQLVDDRAPLGELFTHDEMAVFDSVADLRDKVRYYLARPGERAAIAARARVRALADHTFERRVDQIFRHTLPPALVAGARLGLRQARLADEIDRQARSAAMSSEEALLRVLAQVQAR